MKEQVLLKVKEMLKEEGKAELMEFAEDLAMICYKIVVIIVEESETKLDDVVLAALDGVIKKAIDKLDGKEE